MNTYAIPIDWALASKVYHQNDIDFLRYLGVKSILDIDRFRKEKGFDPDIGSLFLFGQGGSYDFDDPTYGNINILNGTLWFVNGYDLGDLSYDYYDNWKSQNLQPQRG